MPAIATICSVVNEIPLFLSRRIAVQSAAWLSRPATFATPRAVASTLLKNRFPPPAGRSSAPVRQPAAPRIGGALRQGMLYSDAARTHVASYATGSGLLPVRGRHAPPGTLPAAA